MNQSKGPALILIDIQKGFEDISYWGDHRNNPNAEQNASEILSIWRKNNFPVFHIKHNSTNPDSPLHPTNPGNKFNDLVNPQPNETILDKNVNSAFIGTGLKERLDVLGIKQLVIVGLTTDHCVSTTVRMAANLGYEAFLVHDAAATFAKVNFDGTLYSADLLHQTAITSLNEEFARIISTEILRGWSSRNETDLSEDLSVSFRS